MLVTWAVHEIPEMNEILLYVALFHRIICLTYEVAFV